MNYFFGALVLITLYNSCFGAVLPKDGCSISVNNHLADPQPLLLLQNGAVSDTNAFPLPIDDKGTVTFAKGATIDLACPGSTININGANTGQVVVEAKCESGIKFIVQSKSTPFNTITCKKDPYHLARYTNKKCATKYREIEVGFDVNKRFIRHLTICFDDVMQNVLYTQSHLTSAIDGFQVGYPRPDFIVGSFYNVKPDNVNNLYSRKGQRKTINKLLGLSESDTSIIHPTNDYFLARGHYTPKSDYVYGSQQKLTFYYVNVAPQWQTANGGNWNIMEGNCKDLAADRGLDLVVYTGGHGIATLPDTKGKQQQLYLWINGNKKGLPVPELFYKVVYDPITKAGVALIQVNNPYEENVNSHIICKNVCDKVKWLTWKREDLRLGYSYCCEVNDFRKTVTILPEFDVKLLLV